MSSLEARRGGLYARRVDIFPKAVDGFFRRLKWAIMAIALTIYYATPWLRWDRGSYAPNQAVLVDLSHRRFYFFSIEIWPHEFYYVAGLLVMAGVGLFLITSTVGRAWCGYACPQTVWTDLFLHVERFIEGGRNAQLKLKRAPLSAAKVTRKIVKHAIWLCIAMATGGAWIFYFADAPVLARQFLSGAAAPVAYATVGILTATTYVLAGWMREQVCNYMCPWPRIQSAMLDERSLTVTYKYWRGEPRSHGTKKAGDFGDCVDCLACVQVCPAGIDIRNGSQMECITCALCIDACDQVMVKLGRPRGLIDYATLEDCQAEASGKPPVPVMRTLLRSRTLIYFGLWAVVGGAMALSLGQRLRLDLSVAQERNPLWTRLSNGDVRNAYTVHVRNMEERPRTVRLAIGGLPSATMWDSLGSEKMADRAVTFTVGPDQVESRRIYVRAPAAGPEHYQMSLAAQDQEHSTAIKTVRFERPEEGR
jgi:cytochrome c oxidase accessory protein FixG